MLHERDLKNLALYLEKGKVVRIDVKDCGRKGREVLLEYEDGTKYAGNLDTAPFRMQRMSGITSIASYFARGKYGNSSWRGNCSGLLIKDLLQYYKPDVFGDLAVGSGTSIDVAKDLGYTASNTVFSDLNPKYGGVDISSTDMDFPLMDFIFFHPPYYVFPVHPCRYIPEKDTTGKACGEMRSILATVHGSQTREPSRDGSTSAMPISTDYLKRAVVWRSLWEIPDIRASIIPCSRTWTFTANWSR